MLDSAAAGEVLVLNDPIEDAPQVLGQLHCKNCGAMLGVVHQDGQRTSLHTWFGAFQKVVVLRADVPCSECGNVTAFHSRPMSAVRLGIGGGDDD